VAVRRVVVERKERPAPVRGKGKRRDVILTEKAISYLDLRPTPLTREGLIFPAPRGGFIDVHNLARRHWHPAVIATGLEDRNLYQTRHTFACRLLEIVDDLFLVGDQLGHDDLNTTKTYYARY